VPVPGHASWSHAALCEALAATNPTLAKQLQPAPHVDAALEQAAADGRAEASEPVVVAGSLYLIGHLLSQ
jgi:folylpolyglutamate synthase/dihydropteroate synthase